jgi:hypothetical protein
MDMRDYINLKILKYFKTGLIDIKYTHYLSRVKIFLKIKITSN